MRRRILGFLAIGFGVMTLIEGGGIIFGGPDAWAEAGNVVPWVLHFNFVAGFFYIATAILTLLKKAWAVHLAAALAITNVVVLLALGIHVSMGLPFEPRTAVAMTLRTVFWSVQFWQLRKVFGTPVAA